MFGWARQADRRPRRGAQARQAGRKIVRSTMRATRPRPARLLGLSWLFWLALLLPVAQSAAAWHAYTHHPVGAADEQPAQAAHCDLCLAAAAVDGGALVGAQAALQALDAQHALVEAFNVCLWPACTTPVYLSRAPPCAPA